MTRSEASSKIHAMVEMLKDLRSELQYDFSAKEEIPGSIASLLETCENAVDDVSTAFLDSE